MGGTSASVGGSLEPWGRLLAAGKNTQLVGPASYRGLLPPSEGPVASISRVLGGPTSLRVLRASDPMYLKPSPNPKP